MWTRSGSGVDALLPQPRPDLHERAPEQIQALVDLPIPKHRILVEEHEIRRARRQQDRAERRVLYELMIQRFLQLPPRRTSAPRSLLGIKANDSRKRARTFSRNSWSSGRNPRLKACWNPNEYITSLE